MEKMETSLFDLQVDHEASTYLRESARWGKFISVVGFVFCGLILLSIIVTGSNISATWSGNRSFYSNGPLATILMSVVLLLYFFPCLYLNNFSNKMQAALRSNDQVQLNQAFKNLRLCYRFLGILTILWIVLVILIIIVNIFSSL